MSQSFRQFYDFGPFALDVSERVLARAGEPVHLTPKEFDTLLALVRGAGRVMSKEELLKEIWPDTFVGEATLAQNVFTLRRALGESEGGRPFIETVPRRGYRFAVKVSERREAEAPDADAGGEAAPDFAAARSRAAAVVGDENPTLIRPQAAAPEAATHVAAPPPEEGAAEPPGGRARAGAPSPTPAHPPTPARAGDGHPARAAVLIALAVFGAVAALVYAVHYLSVRPDVERARTPATGFQSMKVTRLPVTGSVAEAVISPDGNYLAYVATEPGRQGAGVWVRQVGAASNTQQLAAPAEGTFYGALVFSPDSRHVYYGAARGGPTPPTFFRVPVLGGPPEKILEARSGEVDGPFAFSPDGRRLAYVRGRPGQEMALVVTDISGENAREVVRRSPPEVFGLPAWSPDGESLACVYGSAEKLEGDSLLAGVTTFRLSDGAERRVTEGRWTDVRQLSWLPDGSGVVLSAAEQELSPAQIWQVALASGEGRRITNDLNTYLGASLTADGSALVTVQTDRAPNIWVAPSGDAARARQLTTGSGKFDGFYGLSWTPDGRVVYASMAGGNWDIWVMNADGTGPRQLTVGARANYGPSVSPDGRHVVFVSNRAGGAFNIWRMDSDGGNPVRLTSGRGENFPHVTPDGRWVIYASVGGPDAAVWKVPIDGGEPVRLTDKPSSWPYASPDGKSFVCTYGEGAFSTSKLAVIPIEGGEPTRLYDIAPTFRANTVWLPDNRGIAFLDARTGVTNVWVQPLSGGKPVQLTNFSSDPVTAFDWSRDNRLVATRSVETTGVVLMRDFR